MFAGHYAVALAAKRFTPGTSLGTLFLAVQLLDIVWAPLVLLGVEHVRVVPGLLPASALDLYDYPWSHGLVAAIAFGWFAFRFSKNAVLGGCILSHWVLDFVAHRPDLPLFRGGTRVGLGLWRYRELTMLVECGMLVAGLLIYERSTRAKTAAGAYAMRALCGAIILIEAFNLNGPAPVSARQVAVSAEAAFLVLAAVAWRLDGLREPIIETEPPLSILAS